MTASRMGLLGRKVGMTRIFLEDGTVVPVTVIKAGPCPVVRTKLASGKDRYNAVVVAFEPVRPKVVRRPELSYFQQHQLPPHRYLREFRTQDAPEATAGDVLKVTMFGANEIVDVTGKRKGRGFQGVMKRHGFHGLPGSHGTKLKDRHPGSIGACAYPARVFPGKRMAGRMGADVVTTRGLRVVGVKEEENLLLIRGAVPGPSGGLVIVRKR
ncbi:MAG: 50S ribosomal protein L3 [Candidatus Schekmanbacteria bacterium]|nr:50S ribosomal protein L3 [Candidatus Schekmanbacteria bacterium]